ncbi:hypothetical protein, partial [Hymenobacter luteus]
KKQGYLHHHLIVLSFSMLALALSLSIFYGQPTAAVVDYRSNKASVWCNLECEQGYTMLPIQPDTCVPPSYLHKAYALVEKVITQQEGWLNFGYANSGGFNSIEQYRRQGAIRIIPMAYLPVQQFLRYQPGDNLVPTIHWDTLHFQAFAYKGRKPIGHLAFSTSPDTAHVSFSCGSVKKANIQRYLPIYGRYLFLNVTLGAYCVLANGTMRVLNLRTGELQSVDAWMQAQGGLEAVKKRIADYYSEG